MIIHCKNTLGDGTVIYKDYEVDDPVPEEEELTSDEALNIILGGDTNEA